jgi:DNA (cytosine-5)-methyltransferase 1
MAAEFVTPALPELTFIDLFCGCGGFSLGLERAGLHCLAAIDISPEAIETFSGPSSHSSTGRMKYHFEGR